MLLFHILEVNDPNRLSYFSDWWLNHRPDNVNGGPTAGMIFPGRIRKFAQSKIFSRDTACPISLMGCRRQVLENNRKTLGKPQENDGFKWDLPSGYIKIAVNNCNFLLIFP